MAKTVNALFSTRARGSIGGVITYQGRKSYYHAHKKPTPRNPNTLAQQDARLLLANAVAQWHTLTASEKAVYDRLGEDFHRITGFNFFVRDRVMNPRIHVKFGQHLFGAHFEFGGPYT